MRPKKGGVMRPKKGEIWECGTWGTARVTRVHRRVITPRVALTVLSPGPASYKGEEITLLESSFHLFSRCADRG